MGESTVDWSLLGRLQHSPESGRGRKGRRATKGVQGGLDEPNWVGGDSRPRISKGTAGGGKGFHEDAGSALQEGAVERSVAGSEVSPGCLGIKLRKGRYSKKKGRK